MVKNVLIGKTMAGRAMELGTAGRFVATRFILR
jgi:hypothetical protein